MSAGARQPELPPALDGATSEAIEEIYARLDEELRQVGATCDACGECCHFDAFGHQLWVTRLELEYLIRVEGLRPVTGSGVCPYLEGARCVARRGRTVGCRVFHCEVGGKGSVERLEEIAERYSRELMELSGDRSFEELLAGLEGAAASAGRAQASDQPVDVDDGSVGSEDVDDG